MDSCWKDCLLNQFHDVLPGSCIELIVEDAWKLYEDIFRKIMALRNAYHTHNLGTSTAAHIVYNPLSWDVKTVIFNAAGPEGGIPPGPNVQSVIMDSVEFDDSIEGRYQIPSSFNAALVHLSHSGYSQLTPLAPKNPVSFDSE